MNALLLPRPNAPICSSLSRLVEAPYRAYTPMIASSDSPCPKSRTRRVGSSSVGNLTCTGRSTPAARCASRAFVAYSRTTANGASEYRFVSTDITCAIPCGSMDIATPAAKLTVPSLLTPDVGFRMSTNTFRVEQPRR